MAAIFSNPIEFLILVPVLLICMTVHEMSHGYAAYLMGDNTAKNMQRLSPNPIKHVDPLGLISLMFFRFGWAKPVPINMMNFKNPKQGMAISALAGPLSNILMAFLSLLVYLAFEPANIYVVITLKLMWEYNTMFAVFNLLPVPPLDGSKIVGAFLPDRLYMKLMYYERYGMPILVVLLFSGVLSGVLSNAGNNLLSTMVTAIELIVR